MSKPTFTEDPGWVTFPETIYLARTPDSELLIFTKKADALDWAIANPTGRVIGPLSIAGPAHDSQMLAVEVPATHRFRTRRDIMRELEGAKFTSTFESMFDGSKTSGDG